MRFVVKTNDEQDLEYLDRLVNTASSYTRFDLPNRDVNFGQTWDIFERGIMYVKIDDDVVWILLALVLSNNESLKSIHLDFHR